jgi:hypothetical protein
MLGSCDEQRRNAPSFLLHSIGSLVCFGHARKSSDVCVGNWRTGGYFQRATSLTEVMEVCRKTTARNLLILKAGDGDRTRDVQLGKLAFN